MEEGATSIFLEILTTLGGLGSYGEIGRFGGWVFVMVQRFLNALGIPCLCLLFILRRAYLPRLLTLTLVTREDHVYMYHQSEYHRFDSS